MHTPTPPRLEDLYKYPTLRTRGCDTCHLYLKVSKGKRRRIMETQIFHYAKIKSSKNILQKKPKSFKIL
jgi:hypothetical protein